jgi:DNA-binding LacI/PurR family transcriptional regulator
MKPRVTQREVARATGLHPTTVSLALRGSDKLLPETVRLVRETAERLGYRPDPVLDALNAYRVANRSHRDVQALAWIDAWRHLEPQIFTSGTFAHLYARACEQAERKGFRIESFHLGPGGYSAARLAAVLYQRGIQGIIVGPMPGGRAHLRFDWDNFSAISISSSLARPELHRVSHDHHLNMRLLLRGLRRAGRERPGLVLMRHEDLRTDNQRHAAFLALEQHPRERPPANPVPLLFAESLEEAGLVDWYRQHKPDAIIVTRSNFAARLLRQAGVDVPGEVLVASPSAQENPGSPGVLENQRLLIDTALDHLTGMIHRGEKGLPAEPIRLLVPGAWTDGSPAPEAPEAGPRK